MNNEGIIQRIFAKHAFVVNGITVYYDVDTMQDLIAEVKKEHVFGYFDDVEIRVLIGDSKE